MYMVDPKIIPVDPQDNWSDTVVGQEQSDADWKPPKIEGALQANPQTENLQSPLGFRFMLRRSPNTNYFVHRINVPGILLPMAEEASPYVTIPQPGDHPTFDPLVLTFRVDEGMNNYFELQKWMLDIAGTDGGEAYKKLNDMPEYTGFSVRSEILVSCLNAQKNPVRHITYHDCWPTQLTGLQYDASLNSIDYLIATCTFRYIFYESTTEV